MAVASVMFDIRAGVAKLNQDFSRAEKMVSGSMKRIQRIMTRGAIALGAAVGVNAIRNMALQVTQLGDDLDKMSQRTGVSAEALQGLQYGAEQSGASVDNLQRAMRNLSERIGETAAGTDRFVDRYRRFGVELVDAEGNARATEDVFEDVADVLASMEDGAAKTEAAMKLLGVNAGPRLLPMLNQGKEGLRQFHAEARALGLVMSNEAVQALSNFSTNIGRLKSLATGTRRQIMAGLAQPLEAVTERMFEAGASAERYAAIQEQAAQAGEILLHVIDGLSVVLGYMMEPIREALPSLSDIVKGFRDLRTSAMEGGASFDAFVLALKGFRSYGAYVAGVLEVLRNMLGGIGAALVALVSGNFIEAIEVAKGVGLDIEETVENTARRLKDIWTKSSKETADEARKFSAGLGSALNRVRNSGDGARRSLAAFPAVVKEAGGASASAARDMERLARALEDNARETQIMLARSLGDQVRVMRLELERELAAIDRMMEAGELSAEDHATRRQVLERDTEARITQHYAEEAEKRRQIREQEYEQMEREKEEAQRIGFGIAQSFTDGFRSVFESADFRGMIRGLLNTFARVASFIPGANVAGMGASVFAGFFSRGGLVEGPGTGTSDSILARVSDGEYISTAAAVRSFGTAFFDRLNQGIIDLSVLPRYASGGVVGAAPAAATAPPVGMQQAPVVYMQAFDPRSTAEAMRQVWGPVQYRRALSRQDSREIAGLRRRVHMPRSGR